MEDNPGDTRLVIEMVRSLPKLRVTCTDRLTTGLESLRTHEVDVILLDLGLPDSQGLETLSAVLHQAAAVPVIVLTALQDGALALEAVQAGAQDFLVKGHFDEYLLPRAIQYAIERKRTEEALRRGRDEIEQTLEGTIRVLAAAAEIRDPYTAGHQRRVSALATAIAESIPLPTEQANALRLAALIHDVGKLSVPADILVKPASLTATEWLLVKAHPQVGYDLLKDVKFRMPVADIVVQHHERLDGSGYPQGLSGNEILLEARILAVADVVEAMSSHCPYRPALGLDAALAEIEAGKGSRYDPAVVDACLAAFRKGFVLPSSYI